MTHTLRMTVIGLASVILTSCGGGGGGGSDPGDTDVPGASTASLSRVADCDELLAAFRTDARARIDVQADELRARGWVYAGAGRPTPSAAPTPLAEPTASPPGAPGPDATDTNTQVAGVDEADAVEIDGDRIYLLQGLEVVVLTALPPEATAVAERIPIEGTPLGMFVADGRALVVSQVVDFGSLGGSTHCGGLGAPFPTSRAFGQFPSSCQPLFTKLTLIDVASTPARVLREVYVEGNYVSARRHGTRARVIVARTWGAPPDLVDPWDVLWSPTPPATEAEFVARVDLWEATARAAVDGSTLADWLPAARERHGDRLAEHALTCAHAEVPPAAETREGATVIVGLDLASADAPLDDTLLLGDASQIYASGDTLVLAHPAWQAEPLGDADTRTALHVFALPANGGALYRGSGFVPGTLLSQFAIDVRDDVLRVATSFTTGTSFTTVTRVTTTRIDDGALVTLGQTGDLGRGEQLQGVRFVGDRAYLVTFVRVDPLFVVDLADPAHPQLLGEVELPGFSEYLHPLDADHLLTIGRGATTSGQRLGVALRLFDVASPTAPRLTAEYVMAADASTPAEYDHLAFVFEPRLGLLALPFDRYDRGPHATLELFAIDAAGSIALRGTVDHGTPPFVPCPPPYEGENCQNYEAMLRGLFIDDVVYSISTRRGAGARPRRSRDPARDGAAPMRRARAAGLALLALAACGGGGDGGDEHRIPSAAESGRDVRPPRDLPAPLGARISRGERNSRNRIFRLRIGVTRARLTGDDSAAATTSTERGGMT